MCVSVYHWVFNSSILGKYLESLVSGPDITIYFLRLFLRVSDFDLIFSLSEYIWRVRDRCQIHFSPFNICLKPFEVISFLEGIIECCPFPLTVRTEWLGEAQMNSLGFFSSREVNRSCMIAFSISLCLKTFIKGKKLPCRTPSPRKRFKQLLGIIKKNGIFNLVLI